LIVKYLVESGANPIITNRKGQTPLNFANEKLDSSFTADGVPLAKSKRAGSAKGGLHKIPISPEILKAQAENIKGIRMLLSKSQEGM
jgi:hypothetical protein